MDGLGTKLHYSNMGRIPTYALYGEAGSERHHDWLHWETIQARSSLHGYRIAPHRHEHLFQVLHLAGGAGRASVDGATFELGPGSVVVVPALTVHGFTFSPDVAGVVVTLLERDLGTTGVMPPGAGVVQEDTAGIADALARLIGEADDPGSRHDLAMRAHVTLLLLALQRASGRPAADTIGPDRSRRHAEAFRRLVEGQFRQTRRVADYAQQIGISHTHLNRVSRQVLGASALAVIERRVALEARRQLQFSTLSIKQIGAELGYEDPAYFTRFATRLLGMAPSAFRRKMRG
ncbi:helix-turn-helix domain-containing protein [Devosia sp.]|uniref:helix-turn-helix domain-containing protein n=1 Tax=Devosia sp. TaxID=1871048 RepID=UPI0035AE5B68